MLAEAEECGYLLYGERHQAPRPSTTAKRIREDEAEWMDDVVRAGEDAVSMMG